MWPPSTWFHWSHATQGASAKNNWRVSWGKKGLMQRLSRLILFSDKCWICLVEAYSSGLLCTINFTNLKGLHCCGFSLAHILHFLCVIFAFKQLNLIKVHICSLSQTLLPNAQGMGLEGGETPMPYEGWMWRIQNKSAKNIAPPQRYLLPDMTCIFSDGLMHTNATLKPTKWSQIAV